MERVIGHQFHHSLVLGMSFLVGGFNPFEKKTLVKLDEISRGTGENNKICEEPPRSFRWNIIPDSPVNLPKQLTQKRKGFYQ